MNIHHLELFYYVARHGGISEAVRNIPYGIQQPAVSGQVAQLEEDLGITLFHRRPFALTPQGEKLYAFIQPFFSNLDSIANELRNGKAQRIRVGASTTVLRDHLPEIIRNVRKKFPALKVALCEAYQPTLEAALLKDDLDLAITLIQKKSPPGIQSHPLVELPLILLVEKNSPVTSAAQLWKQDRIAQPLISLSAEEAFCITFQQKLAEMGMDWFPSIEVSSIDLIETYVANGFGIGLSVVQPKSTLPENLRAIPLPDFPPVTMGALWRGKKTPLIQGFLDELQARAKALNER
jgi:DNA-binding transcriptional LysR family regulator